jgi:hypothetical protein
VADRELAVLPTHPQRSSGSWLLKLHGSVDTPSDMVLTRSDFLEMPRYRGALIGLVQGLLLTRHMLYVGYSLSDEDFQELIHEVRTARGTSGAAGATMLTIAADQVQRDLWSDDLDVIAMTKPGSAKQTKIAEAAREMEIFLDLVGFLSTTSAAFFLDRAYSQLSQDESYLQTQLQELAHSIRGPKPDDVAHKVRRFLQELGAEQAAGAATYTARITFADQETGRIRFPKKSAELLTGISNPVDVMLRGSRSTGEWQAGAGTDRSATLRLTDPSRLTMLVGVGERLTVTVDANCVKLD